MDARVIRCRMTNKTNDRCTVEALDPAGEVLICQRHAELVLELFAAQRRGDLPAAGVTMTEVNEDLRGMLRQVKEIGQ